jgi:hypothetical protein
VAASARALAQRLRERAAQVLEVARSGPAGGGPDWDALLLTLAIRPLTADERQRHLAAGPPIRAGALPNEVRRALDQVRASTDGELAAVDRDDPERDELARELARFVDRGVREHIAAIRPPAPTSSIFANAARTTARYQPTAAGVETLTCAVCGAARADEAVEVCQFCGTPLPRGGA